MAMDSVTGCTHCGAPLGSRVRARPDGEAFCCSGCHVAWHLSGRSVEGHTDRLLARLVLSAFLAMGVMVFSLSLYGVYLGRADIGDAGSGETAEALRGVFRLGALALSAPVMVLLGGPLLAAQRDMRRWLSADALVLLGCASAWTVSVWNSFAGGGEVYFDTATAVLVLYTLGRWLDARARQRGAEQLTHLAAERETPVALLEHGCEREVPWSELRVGDRVRLRPGEIVPVDGRVDAGRSFVDASALTGEEEPFAASSGTRVLAGSTLLDGSLDVTVEAGAGERARDAMERLLAEARASRPQLVRVADSAVRVLLPLVLVLALGTAVVRGRAHGLEEGLLSALAVVLISCPCALGIATPLAYWTALGAAWQRGLLVRGGEVLERVARARRVFLDKTGTLTTGEFALAGVRTAAGVQRAEALALAAALERGSEHPIGRALVREWHATRAERANREGRASDADHLEASEFRALPGIGVEGVVDGRQLVLERAAKGSGPETVVRLAEGELELARFLFLGELRPEAERLVRGLEQRGLEPRVLTGDGRGPADALAAELGLDVDAELLPEQKVERVRDAAGGRGVLFLGDGLNDAAALAAADVGIAMPRGSAVGQAAAGVQLLRPDLGLVLELVDLARHAVSVARLNLAWAFGYNAIGLGLAVTGRLTPVFAASAMAASSALVVLNSSRIARRVSGQGGARPTNNAYRVDRVRTPTLALEESIPGEQA